VDYRITVRLDPLTHRLAGHERVTWHNPSAEPVGELWLHLYLNAFKNTRSTFLRESAGRVRNDTMTEGGWGFVNVTALRREDGQDLRPALAFEHPDDDNADDQTVARLALPEAVPPRGRITLDVDWEAQLPRVFARTGFVRDFHMAGQWFPKLAVFEPAGLRGRARGGWNAHQFHAMSEFYADFGRYHVEITVPRRFVVGATGSRTGRRDNPDGTTTHTYEQADVHDFAWTADPGFVEVRRTFSADADVTPAEYADAARLLGRGLDEVRLSDVELVLLMQPRHLPQLERHVEAAKIALKWFGLWYGRYPYPTLTIVDPAVGAGGAWGMEYPTLVTGGTSFLLDHAPLDHVRLPEVTIIHEIAHQWFYGLLASNEFEEAWLDEGIGSYAETQAYERGYGPGALLLDVPGLRLRALEYPRLGNSPERAFDSVRRPAWTYSPGAYGFYSYARPPLMLETLGGIVGAETLARLMRTYAERFRFRHPSSDDFYAVAREVSGRDLRSFFEQTVERPGVLDYEVASVETEKVKEPRGVFEKDERLEAAAGGPVRPSPPAKTADPSGGPWQSTVLVRRRGEIALPVEVELRFEGGATDRRSWDGRERWVRYQVTRPERLLSASVDPDGKLALEADALNDARRVDGDAHASVWWASRFTFWAQQALAFVGM
jgi:peptidase M1-like protein